MSKIIPLIFPMISVVRTYDLFLNRIYHVENFIKVMDTEESKYPYSLKMQYLNLRCFLMYLFRKMSKHYSENFIESAVDLSEGFKIEIPYYFINELSWFKQGNSMDMNILQIYKCLTCDTTWAFNVRKGATYFKDEEEFLTYVKDLGGDMDDTQIMECPHCTRDKVGMVKENFMKEMEHA